jgi:ComF family protein
MQPKSWLRLGVRAMSQLLWPPACITCDAGISRADGGLCQDCWGQLLACTGGDYCPRCGRNASRYGMVGGTCPACQGLEIHFDGIARVGLYADTLRSMILAFKHDRCELVSILVSLAGSAMQGCSFQNSIDLLVPVPLHWTRRLSRGYNQSLLIAKRLCHANARVSTDLVRVRRTKPQPMMPSPAARARNVEGSFAVRPDHRFAGKTICLIDDIKTTGATLNECAKTLKEADAAKVYALVLAVAGQNST